MKKNILTIIIMAATLVNTALLVLIIFALVPAMDKSNTLVSRIASIIDLEIDSENKEDEAYTFDDLETYTIALENKQTINLKPSEGTSKAYYAMFESVTIAYNKKAKDYEKIKESVEAGSSSVYIVDIVKSVITEYNVENLSEDAVKTEAIKRIQEFYSSNAIVKLTLGGFMHS